MARSAGVVRNGDKFLKVMNLKTSFPIYELVNKYGFSDGEEILPEEKPALKAACKKLADLIGIVEGRWEPVVSKASHNPYYVKFYDLTTESYTNFYTMPERERRKIQERLDATGWYEISVDVTQLR